MNEHDLTPWFDGQVKPARPGVYMQMCGGDRGYQYWDGKLWRGWYTTPDNAARNIWPAPINFQNDPWRGLSRKPSK